MTKFEEDTVVTPRFSGWPYLHFKQFQEFAKQETGNSYWMAVKLLMERNEELERMKVMMFGHGNEETEEEPEEEPSIATLGR